MAKHFLFLFYIMFALSVSIRGQSEHGKLVYLQFTAESIRGNRGGEDPIRRLTIYLPPGYDKSKDHYPVVYFLHGYGGEDSSTMADIHLNDLIEEAVLARRIKRFILVLPNSYTHFKGSFYTNSTLTGNWADYIAKDVVNYVDQNFRTIRNRNSRGICGISMGGNGALKIAMLFPSVFGCVYAMTPAVLNWSDGNNTGLSTFKDIDTLKSESEISSDSRQTLYIDLGRTYSPNLQKPPFYADMPAYYIGDSLIVDSAVVKKWESNFPTMMIESHVAALKSLNAIKLEWGRNDEGKHVPVTCLEFSKKLERYGIRHFAEEYLGGHAGNLGGLDGRVYTEVLPFFDTYLKWK
jgi:S-formylglutathione hydrolase FrmB